MKEEVDFSKKADVIEVIPEVVAKKKKVETQYFSVRKN